MSEKYLVYLPGETPPFGYVENEYVSDVLSNEHRREYIVIKIDNYNPSDPDESILTLLPKLTDNSSETSPESSPGSPESSDPVLAPPPPVAPEESSPLYEFGIVSPSKEEEANIRRYNLNIFNVMEFTENYSGRQSEANEYYGNELDKVKQSLTEREYTKVNDKTSREYYIIHNNRVIEYAIVYIRTMNNYKYIDTEDIKVILENLNFIHEHLDDIYKQIGLYINKKLGRTSYDNAVIKLKVAVAYYLLAEYKDADKIFDSIDLNEVPSNGLLYMYIKYYHALVKQVQLNFLESDSLIIELMGHNNDLRTNSPNMYIRCMMVRGDNALFLYNKSQALSFYEKILRESDGSPPITFTAIKADNPSEQEFYNTMPEIMNTLVKSRYATVRYYLGDDKPTFAELQEIVKTFRKHLPAFHPYTVDAQVTLLLTNFASKPAVNQSTLIDLMERMYIINWNAYPMKFLHYMSLYSLVKPQVEVNKKINVYDIIVNEYIKQIIADKTVFNITNETALETGITNKVIEVNAKKDEIKTYFDNTTDIPVEELRNQIDGGFHELPALFVFDYLKTILMNTSEVADKTRDALKARFQEAILDRIPEQKNSLKVAVKNPIDTTGLPQLDTNGSPKPGTDPHFFKGVLYEVIAGDDKGLLKMAHEEYLQTDITARNVINLHDTTFDVEGTSVEVDLVTKVDNSKKSSLERLKGAFKAGKRIPDYVRITTTKNSTSNVVKLKIGDKFKLPQHKDLLTVVSYMDGLNNLPLKGIMYRIGNQLGQNELRTPSKIAPSGTPAQQATHQATQQERAKNWIYISQTLPTQSVPTRGGTRSKRKVALEKKTRKVRGGLSVKMEE